MKALERLNRLKHLTHSLARRVQDPGLAPRRQPVDTLRTGRLVVAAALAGAAVSLAHAQSADTRTTARQTSADKPRPWMACFDTAAQHHGVSAEVLKAIAEQESSMRPHARNQNTDGSHDLGLMQINSLWFEELARRGVSMAQLLDPCTNIHAGAWILSKQIERFGNTWRAVGAYHSRTPEHNARYAWGVYRRLSRVISLSNPATQSAPAKTAKVASQASALANRVAEAPETADRRVAALDSAVPSERDGSYPLE
jgi:soluble lytic murein transglycosylase-like protein